MGTLVKNGTIVNASDEYVGDVLFEDGKITAIAKNIPNDGHELVDAEGLLVMPGGVDQHVHFSFEFNGTTVRGFETSAAAALGGTTTVIEFVNQVKGKGLVQSIEDYKKEKVENIAAVDYAFHAIMTDPRDEVFEEIPRMADAGYPTIKLFMAYKGMFFHADDDAILKSLMAAKEAGITIMVHAENADAIDVLQRQCIAAGNTGPYYHAVSRPPAVEAEATKRAIYLAQMADAPLYVVHVSCREALDEIAQAAAQGRPVKGETCSHYLTLDESNLAKPNFEGAKYVCSPALRTPDHFDSLWNGLRQDWLNAVSSDHCGFDWEKQKHMGIDDFRNIPNGAPGMENRMAVLWTYGVESGKISRQKFVELASLNPAKINGLYPQKGHIGIGADADIILWDPKWKGVMSVKNSLQGVDYCAYEGMEQTGRAEKVFLRGKLLVDDAKYIGQKGDGQFVAGSPFGLMYQTP